MGSSTLSNPRAIYGCPRTDIPGVQIRAQAMHDGVVANIGSFAALPITMVAFLALITALAGAQQNATITRARGTAKARNTKRNALWTAMEIIRVYVQSLADSLDAESAAALIESAGLLVGTAPHHTKDILAAKLTATSGVVHLDANASLLVGPADAKKKTTFNWQCSSDGGKTWVDLRSTPYGNTDVPGLTLLTLYSFRVSVTVGKATGSWSQAINLLVH